MSVLGQSALLRICQNIWIVIDILTDNEFSEIVGQSVPLRMPEYLVRRKRPLYDSLDDSQTQQSAVSANFCNLFFILSHFHMQVHLNILIPLPSNILKFQFTITSSRNGQYCLSLLKGCLFSQHYGRMDPWRSQNICVIEFWNSFQYMFGNGILTSFIRVSLSNKFGLHLVPFSNACALEHFHSNILRFGLILHCIVL